MSYRTMTDSHPRHGFEALDFVVVGFLVLLLVVVGLFRDRLPDPRTPVVAFATALVAYLVMVRALARLNPGPGVSLVFRSIALCFVFPYAYMHLDLVNEFINPFRAEFALMAIDRFIFAGHSPNVLLQGFLNPLAVDVFQLVYATYYPLFLTLLVLVGFGEYDRMASYLTSVAFLLSLTFIIYMLVPARSPYIIAGIPEYSHVAGLTQAVQGGPLAMHIRDGLHNAAGFKFDCFPSGHTAGAVLVFLSLYSWKKLAGLIAAPVCLALIFSTVYLQYHYVIDVIAGAGLAVAVFYLGRIVIRYVPYLGGVKGESR